jgi:hypothetical protein
MGFGASLGFIAIGAILAFATRFNLAGIDVKMIGWILMAVGVIGMIITLGYTRPRRRRQVAEVIGEEPAYMTYPEEAAPHVVTRREIVEPPPVPGRHFDDGLR